MLTPAILSSLIAYLVTSICAVVLIHRRSASKRIRLLAWCVGVVPMVKAISILHQKGILPLAPFNAVADYVDLFVALLFLYAMRKLDKASRDRKRMEYQLRLVESEAQKANDATPNLKGPSIKGLLAGSAV